MPIGKNAIKRVADSTKKETLAKAAEVTPAPEKTAKKPALPKTAAKATAKATTKATAPKAAKPVAKKPAAHKAALKTAAEKPLAKAAPEAKKDGFNRINIGGELPVYLL